MADAASTILIKQRETTHVGSRYEGKVSIATGQRDGYGKYMYPNSYFTYEGEWSSGKKHGQGRLSFGDGGFYEGAFVQGEILGQGEQNWPDGTVYTGQFVDGTRHGEGHYQKSDGSCYKGSWERNRYCGHGELTLPDGSIYLGEFQAHKYHGQGKLTDPGADRIYTGGFEAGYFQGEGELQERGGVFEYKGQFQAGSMSGSGKGTDTRSGIAYAGEWSDNIPTRQSASWDLGSVETEESYLIIAETLREEAANQLNPVAADPKAKGKKADPKKAAAPAAAPEDEESKPTGPELELQAGRSVPEVVLRLVDAEKVALPGESGRLFRVSMYRERKAPSAEDPSVTEVIRREVRFGDLRQSYIDPLDVEASSQPVSGKSTPAPPPSAGAEDAAPEEEPYIGEPWLDGQIGDDGRTRIGNSEEWFLPIHLIAGIYFIRVEDISQKIQADSLWQALGAIEVPVRVKPAEAPSTA